MTNRKNIRKAVSIFLVVFMLIAAFPMGVFANENETITPTEETVNMEENPNELEQPEESQTTNEEETEDVQAVAEDEETQNAAIEQAPMAALQSIAPASANATTLKAQIESATSDTTINLDPGVYEFDSEIKNTNGITITLIGAVDGSGQPATQFTMATGVAGAPRFIRLESGTLSLSNIHVNGTKGLNGGVSARNVVATNCDFTNNYTNDGVSGGGAIRVTGGTLTVEGSSFTGNSVGATSDGGAISSEYSGNIRINNSVFDKNERIGNNNQYGGAISVKQPSVANTSIEITNSIFTNNVLDASGSWTTGGAVRIFGTNNLTSVLIDNVLFKGNMAQRALVNNGGALAFMTTNSSTVSNCTFIDNSSGKYGGAVYYENSKGNHQIINSTFVGNKASFAGNGVSVYSSSTTIDSSTLISNSLSTHGTTPSITIKDSILSGTATYASSTITYTGTNLAQKASTEPAVNSADVFTAYTSTALERVSDSNYVAPIIANGPAYGKVSTARALNEAQNGNVRKTPLSDIGAYEAPKYVTATFDSNGGTTVLSQTVAENTLLTAPTPPTKDDLIFSGWFTDNGTFANEWNFGTDALTADTTLYAKWTEQTYTLTFNLNGAPGTAPAIQTLTKNASITPIQTPIWEGYTLSSWNTEAAGSGDTWDLNTRTMGMENITLYAQWIPNQYKVHFDSNGGTGTMDDEDYTYGESKALFKNTFTRVGYTFKGWSTVKNGNVELADNASYTCSKASDLTLYASWEKNDNEIKKVTPINLPKTGGYEYLFIGILALGFGLFASMKGLNKNKRK